jgi:steroid delta-isomerase-like uncharacterized protein
MAMEPKDVARAFVEEFQEKRDLDSFEELVAPGFVDHSPAPGTSPGAEGVKQLFQMLWSALPDMRVEIYQQLAEGDRVATQKSFIGTHRGDLFGVPPTGKTVHLDIIDIVRVADGKIAEHWNIVDSYGLMQQLGALG